MLLRYNVSNFKSIGHLVEFSMFPTEKNTDERFIKTIDTKAGKWKVLKRGGFFGPNASGKSSFIESIHFARNYILEGQRSGKGTGVNQFRGDFDDLEGVSSFQFLLYIDGDVFEYGFSLSQWQVHEEWLMELTGKGLEMLFGRTTDLAGKTDIKLTSVFGLDRSKDKKLANILISSIKESQKNQLFLYKLYDNGIKRVEKVINWFKKLQFVFPETTVQALPVRMKEDIEMRDYIATMLNNLDTGVRRISIVNKHIDFHELARDLSLPKEVIDDIGEIENGIVNFNGNYFLFSKKEKGTSLIQIKFNHFLNNKEVQFNLDEESDGTQRLVDLLPMLFAIGKNKAIYFVDEIDRSLHTKLSLFLLKEFVRESQLSENQIMFTAHDVNLINLEHFRQDEIWFIEKNNNGESMLRPLSDFSIEKNQDALKAYLNGRFGAIPIIRERG